jgi:hypothetical protein
MKILKIMDEMFCEADREYSQLKISIENLMEKHKSLGFFKAEEKAKIYSEIKLLENAIEIKYYTMYVLGNLRGKIKECEIEEKTEKIKKLKRKK